MSCSSCANTALRAFLRGLDIGLPTTTAAGYARAGAATRSLRSLHTTSRVRSSSNQSHSSQSSSDDAHLPFVKAEAHLQHSRSETTSSLDSITPAERMQGTKRVMKTSGIGPVGQRVKDLQEQVSGVAAVSGVPSRQNGDASQNFSPNEERRMPRRRFEGDRTRPDLKKGTSLKIANRSKGAGRVAQVDKGRSQDKPWGFPESRSRVAENDEDKWAVRRARPAKPTINSKDLHEKDKEEKPRIEPWGIQKRALREKFAEQGWMPRKKLSPDALEGIRTLHAQHPETYTTPILAEYFKISPEAIRRILKSKWRPNDDEEEERKRRWEKRGENIWTQMTELGIKPPKKWREKGIGRLAEREEGGRGRGRGLSTLEEEIGTESDQGVITTLASDERVEYRSLANKII